MKQKQVSMICVFVLLLTALMACGAKETSLERWEKEEISRVRSHLAAGMYYDAQGRSFQLIEDGLYGMPLVVHYWATRTSVSVEGLDAFQEAYEKYGDKVQFLMICSFDGISDTIEDAENLIKEKGYTFPVYYDRAKNLSNSLGIQQFPYTVFIGKSFQIKHIRNTVLATTDIAELIEGIL